MQKFENNAEGVPQIRQLGGGGGSVAWGGITGTLSNQTDLNNQIQKISAVQTITKYVDDATGLDTNDGSQLTPYKTINKALQEAPAFGNYTVRIKAGNYTATNWNNILANKHIYLTIRPDAVADEYSVIESGTMTGNAYFSHTDSTKSWTADVHKGRFLKNTVSGEIFPISYNTATTLYCGGSNTFGVSNITSYEILELRVSINITEAIYLKNSQVYFEKIKMTGSGSLQDYNGLFILNCSFSGNRIWTCKTKNINNSTIVKSFIEMTATDIFSMAFISGCALIKTSAAILAVAVSYNTFFRCSTSGRVGAAISFSHFSDAVYCYAADNMYKDFNVAIDTRNTDNAAQIAKITIGDHFEYDNVNFAFYVDNGISIVDDNLYSVYDKGTPLIGQLTINGTTAHTKFIDLSRNIFANVLSNANYSLKFNEYSNPDVDTGTEVIDSFSDLVNSCGVRWDITISNGGNKRICSINAVWDASTNTINSSTEYNVVTIGTTTDVSLTVDINNNMIRLLATAATDNWSITAQRYLI